MLEVELKAVGYYAMLNSWQPSEDSTAFVDPVASFAKLGKLDNLENISKGIYSGFHLRINKPLFM